MFTDDERRRTRSKMKFKKDANEEHFRANLIPHLIQFNLSWFLKKGKMVNKKYILMPSKDVVYFMFSDYS